MQEDGPVYSRAAETAAHICNLLGGDYPGGRAELFGRILFLILGTIHRIEEDRGERNREPSRN